MKVLITNFHPRNGGGHVTYVLNIVNGLRGEHVFTVATPASSRLYRYAQAIGGVEVVDMRFSMRPQSWWGDRRKLARLIREGAYDIIHVNGSADHKQAMLATLGLRQRPRIVLTKHNDHPVSSLGHRLRALLATDHVIAVSHFVAGLLRHSPYARRPVTVVHHGVDTDYFSPASVDERAAMRERFCGVAWREKIVLGSSGGTDTAKGWLDLLEGIALLPPETQGRFGVLVAGDPPRPEQMARVQALGMVDQVVFPGLLDDVRPALAACDIGFVLSYREALSFACRETMALGLPALVSDAGGLPENVSAGSDGWIVPVRDPAAIAAVLAGIAADPACLSAFGQRARAKSASESGLAGFARATLAVYRQTLAQ